MLDPNTALGDVLARMPAIPRVVQELINSLNDDDADIGSLVARLRQDQVLSARILRLANSSYYHATRKVGAIDDAVVLVGLNALRTLVIASGVSGAFKDVPGVDLPAFWRHALLTALIARELARHAGLSPELAYTAGLMHRIGHLLICMTHPDHARQLASIGRDLSLAELVHTEHELTGTDHSEVGAMLTEHWNFPAVIRSALRDYPAADSEGASGHAAVLALAVMMAQGITDGDEPRLIRSELPSALIEHLGLADIDIDDTLALRQAMLAAASSL